ncbi:MAG: M23 family metallopeptidase [Candidatus Neomarinimicrobiota bacterium]|jgi:murein DD-endopeptidase MepM/ murein hydrolase activator NlpD
MKTDKIKFIFIPAEEKDQKEFSMDHRVFFLLKILLPLILLALIISFILLVPRANKYQEYKTKITTYQSQEKELNALIQDINEMKQFNIYMRELIGLDLTSSSANYLALSDVLAAKDDAADLSSYPDKAPVSGPITQKFSSGTRKHYAIDIGGKIGDPIVAAADGFVVFSGWTPELGNMVVISHPDDYITVYGHNDRLKVRERQRVKKGDIIALLGETGYSMGPHLHFEVWHHGIALDPQMIVPEYMNKP